MFKKSDRGDRPPTASDWQERRIQRHMERYQIRFRPPDAPETTLSYTAQGDGMVRDVLQGAVIASKLVGLAADGNLPDGWRSVPAPEAMAKAYERAGAARFISPSGMEYVAFEDHKPSRFEKLQQKLGIKTDRTRAAYDIGLTLAGDPHVSFTGVGRGGAMAKLAAESASVRLPGHEDVEAKLCVPVNATAIAPKTYAAFGLASKNHERLTINVVNEKDAHDRLKGFARATPLESIESSKKLRAEFRREEVYKVERRSGGRIVGGRRSGEEKSDSLADVRITVKQGELGLENLFKNNNEAMHKNADKHDMPIDMGEKLIRKYLQGQEKNGAALAPGNDASSRAESSSRSR